MIVLIPLGVGDPSSCSSLGILKVWWRQISMTPSYPEVCGWCLQLKKCVSCMENLLETCHRILNETKRIYSITREYITAHLTGSCAKYFHSYFRTTILKTTNRKATF